MNQYFNNDEFYFTMKHFSNVDFTKEISESDNSYDSYDSSSNNSSSNNSSSNNSSSNNSSSSNKSSSNNSTSDTCNTDASTEYETITGSNVSSKTTISTETNLEIDENDLFNTKTNGNEFFGEVLKNRYLIIKKLGYGSFSSVWMAYDVESNTLVAIKIINPQDYKEGMLELQTYKKLNELDSTYLLTMIECFQVSPIHLKYESETYKKKHKKNHNHIVMILPLMACSTFDLLKCDEYDDGLPLEVCKNIILQTLLGIKELEKHNLMHTDLKPENILVCGLNREAEILLKTIHDINIRDVHEKQLQKLITEKTTKDTVSQDVIWITSYKLYKEITRTIIKFIKNDMIDVKKQMKTCKVSSKYIQDIKIKICDFNLVLNLDEHIGSTNIEIQTRYYRAPEIILGAGLHKKTDYWSIGCILFELLTGEMLFDPEKDSVKSRDIHHMYLIEELMGPVPKQLLSSATNLEKLYDSNGYLLSVGQKVKRWNLADVLRDNHDNVALSDEIAQNVVKFINSTLNIIPDNRPNIKTMIHATTKLTNG